ncbi:MAG: 2-hydroxyacyl-CoA dehydratase [Promethearchaeota archaeon]
MSYMADDLVSFKSLMSLAVEFLNRRAKLARMKLREHKVLIGTIFPPVEMIFAGGAYPVFPIRMERFGDDPFLKVLDLASSTLGWRNVVNFLSFARRFDSKDIIGYIMDNIISKINKEYNFMYDLAEEEGITTDSCYGIKAVYGMLAHKGKNLDGIFNYTIRCSAWEKMYEANQKFTKGFWVDVPLRKTEKGRQMLLDDLYRFSEDLEKLTGKPITNNSLREISQITNECKEYSMKIIHEIALGDTYPCKPTTLAEFLSLIEIAFEDYLSDAKLLLKILKGMYNEMKERINKTEYAVDVSKMPKVLLTPRFGGWDSETHNFVASYGGRMIYADWEIIGMFEKIKTTGDMFENYADYLMETVSLFGVNNDEHTDRILNFVVNNNVDAVIYNQLFGCHSLTTGYPLLKQKLLREEIPSTMINFNKIGENLQQTKTRVEALMELI